MSDPAPSREALRAAQVGLHVHADDPPGAGRTPVEEDSVGEVLAAIWQRVLNRSPVGVDNDLLALGATPFDVARAAWLVEDTFDIDIEPAELATAATPSGAAGIVASRRAAPTARPAPVSTSQEGMFWHEQLKPGSFNMAPLVRRHRGHLDRGALGAAFAELARRHQPLRTTLTTRRGRAVQVIGDPPDLTLAVNDLSALGKVAGEAEARRLIGMAASRPFYLEEEAPFQPSLIRLGTEDHLVVVRLHHSAFDDWSVGIYRRELGTIYSSLVGGQSPALGEVAVTFADFARAQRAELAGRTGAAEMAWWKNELAGAPLTTQLEIGSPSANRRPGPSHPVVVALPTQMAGRLRSLARHCRATLFITLLAAFQVLLHRRTREDDLIIATVVANRDKARLEGLIGCFTKKVPLRLRLAGDPSFAELVGHTRHALLGAMAHHRHAYETILQEVLGPGAASHGVVPHVPIMFQGLVPAAEELTLSGMAPSPFGSADTQGPGLHVVGPGLAESDPNRQAEPIVERGVAGRPWGGPLYPTTFLGLSILEHGEDVSCVAQGGFHRPLVEDLMAEYLALLADVVAAPLRPVSKLLGGYPGGFHSGSRGSTGPIPTIERFRGFPLERAEIERVIEACPGVTGARLVVVRGTGKDDPSLVVEVEPENDPGPSLRQLQNELWTRLPGCPWPSKLATSAARSSDGAGGTAAANGGPAQPAEVLLGRAWAQVLGITGVGGHANYWQCFSFLDALARLRKEGAVVGTDQVARNRTIASLASDLATTGPPLGIRSGIVQSPGGGDPDTHAPNTDTWATGVGSATNAAAGPVGAHGVERAEAQRFSGPEDEVIRVEGLSKTYPGGLDAVDSIDLVVQRGEIFGLLGPNGAGKTTTVGMITTRVIPSAGRAWVASVDVVADPALAKQFMGVVPQANNLDNSLSVLENLYYHGRYFGMGARAARATAEEMLERFRLAGRGKDRVDHLSGGMARRLMLARALMQGPAVVFLDEPTAGLDPQSRLALWDIIGELRSEGQTILLTTHYMEEAERFCNRVAIMDHGRILALDTPAQLKRSLGDRKVVTVKGEGDLARMASELAAASWADDPNLFDGGLRVTLSSTAGSLSMLMAEAEASGVRISDLTVLEDSLETVFINLTGRELRE